MINFAYFLLWESNMQILECPKCKQKMIKIYTKGDVVVDFSVERAVETAKCRNCGAKILYSIRAKEGKNGGN